MIECYSRVYWQCIASLHIQVAVGVFQSAWIY